MFGYAIAFAKENLLFYFVIWEVLCGLGCPPEYNFLVFIWQIFIDRDPEAFVPILNFLRTKELDPRWVSSHFSDYLHHFFFIMTLNLSCCIVCQCFWGRLILCLLWDVTSISTFCNITTKFVWILQGSAQVWSLLFQTCLKKDWWQF